MGIDSSTYIGVYLEVPYKKMTNTVSHYVTDLGAKTANRFCPNTGKEHQPVSNSKEVFKRPTSYYEEFESLTEDEKDYLDDELFWTPEYAESPKNTSVFILNNKCKYKLANKDDQSTTDLSNVDIPILLNDFSVEYKNYVDAFKKEYGDVKVKFGVVAYAN